MLPGFFNYFKILFFYLFLDIERYSKRYMKVYKEEWIPGNHKTENVKIIFKGYLPYPMSF